MYLRILTVQVLTELPDEPTLGPVTDFVKAGTPLLRGWPEIVSCEEEGEPVEMSDEEVIKMRTDAYTPKT